MADAATCNDGVADGTRDADAVVGSERLFYLY